MSRSIIGPVLLLATAGIVLGAMAQSKPIAYPAK